MENSDRQRQAIKKQRKSKKGGGGIVIRRSLQNDRVRFFKSEARKLLFQPKNYPKFVAATLINMLLSMGITAIAGLIVSLAGEDVPDYLIDYLVFGLYLLLAMPVGVGFYLFALRSVESAGRAPSVSVILEPFSSAKLLIRIYRCFLAYLWRGALIIGEIAVGISIACRVNDYYLSWGYPVAGAVMMLCICAVTLIFAHFLALILCNVYPMMAVAMKNRDLSIRGVVKISKLLMKGHRFELFGLTFSFGFWALLSAFTAGIVFAAYAAPYFVAANAVYTSYLCDLQDKPSLAYVEHKKKTKLII
ncbi:MAG: DUF975 family protein [Clostridiales bacterium]|nr:DUF975 family protein [Clostridiales bacterium]